MSAKRVFFRLDLLKYCSEENLINFNLNRAIDGKIYIYKQLL